MDERSRAARYSDLFESNHQDVSDCAYCPLCAAISVVRETRPEVLEHLAAAARELIVAAGILLEEAEGVVGGAREPSEKRSSPEGDGPPRMRHIEIG